MHIHVEVSTSSPNVSQQELFPEVATVDSQYDRANQVSIVIL